MIDVSLFDNLNRVALAVSGGKDSMALLYDMARLFEHDFFYVVNVEHGIRGAESVSDSDFVEQYAASLGVEVRRYDVDAVAYSKEHGYTLEQGARLLRREIFKREVDEGRADRVVVAHHQDDNVESVLMHILRGSGLRGLGGMLADDGLLLRPLLTVTRRDIDDFITANNIPYREDSTNSDNSYRRNFIRSEVMPLLRGRYQGVDSSIMRLARASREDDNYLMDIARGKVTWDNGRVLIDIHTDNVILKRAIYLAFSMLDVHADIEERHYNLLIDLISQPNGTTLDMPYGILAVKEYDVIALGRPGVAPLNYAVYPVRLGETMIAPYVVTIEEVSRDEVDFKEKSDGYRVLYVSGDSLEGAFIRQREEGDTFKRYLGGNKKLKDYFIDIKLPRMKRDIPVIARDNEVLVVAGIELSDKASISDKTNSIYRIKLRRSNI